MKAKGGYEKEARKNIKERKSMQIRTENPLTQSYTHVVVSLRFKIITHNTLTVNINPNGLDV